MGHPCPGGASGNLLPPPVPTPNGSFFFFDYFGRWGDHKKNQVTRGYHKPPTSSPSSEIWKIASFSKCCQNLGLCQIFENNANFHTIDNFKNQATFLHVFFLRCWHSFLICNVCCLFLRESTNKITIILQYDYKKITIRLQQYCNAARSTKLAFFPKTNQT